MAFQVKLQRSQIADLAIIRDLESDAFNRISTTLATLDPPPLRPEPLVRALSESGSPNKVAESLVRQLLSIHGLVRQLGISIDVAIRAINQGIQAETTWSEAEKKRWATVERPFQELVASRSIRLVASAIDLSYEYANLLRRARILTDIRPLFDDEGTSIEGSVISHTLRLRYDSSNVDHSLSIAMDEADIKSLLQQCERALTKARTARDLVASRLNVPTVISGGSENA